MSVPRVSHIPSADQPRKFANAINYLLGRTHTVVAKSATYTEDAASGELIILASGTFTINLPTAVGNRAKITAKLLTTASTLTLDAAGAETIDGAATKTITVQYGSLTLVSDGVNWIII